MVHFRKTSAKALKGPLNEVTAIILEKGKKHYHETFLMDLTQDHTFEHDGFRYNVPAEATRHYDASFWAFHKKLAAFFEVHKTLAYFFDWFNLRERVVYEVGYVYEKGQANPMEVKKPEVDWTYRNYAIRHNKTIEGHYKAVDLKLKGDRKLNMNMMLLILAIIAVPIVVIVVLSILTGDPNSVQHVQNVTATLAPSPTQLYHP